MLTDGRGAGLCEAFASDTAGAAAAAAVADERGAGLAF